MILRSALVGTMLFSSVSDADSLALKVEAKNISIDGNFLWNPGGQLKIAGTDFSGVPYEIDVITKIQKDNFAMFICRMSHGLEKHEVSVMGKKKISASVATGPQDGPSDLKFEAKWNE